MSANPIDLPKAKRELLHPLNNVVGVGIGISEKSGRDCLRIYVVKRALFKEPENLKDFEVIEIGRFGRRGIKHRCEAQENPDPAPQPGSPIRVQTDAPNVNSGAIGTLGIVVAPAGNPGTPKRYILGCNHVLAVNGRVREDPIAKIVWARFVGDQEVIADPDVFVPLDRNGANEVDCALARIRDHICFQATFPEEIGALTSPEPMEPVPSMRVRKVGSATGLTEGTIVDVNADLYVDYDFGTFRLNHQIIVDAGRDDKGQDKLFAAVGDSGSILVHTNKEKKTQAVGMVFAASGRFAVACPLTKVLSEFKEKVDVSLRLVTS